jgi:hypothetical protein
MVILRFGRFSGVSPLASQANALTKIDDLGGDSLEHAIAKVSPRATLVQHNPVKIQSPELSPAMGSFGTSELWAGLFSSPRAPFPRLICINESFTAR